MTEIFLDFFDCAYGCVDATSLKAAMARYMGELDLGIFAYLALPYQRQEKARLISTYQSVWTTHYLHNSYERIDPVIAQARTGPEPFEWGGSGSDLAGLSRAQLQLFDEASEFGIRHGFTIPIHDRAGRIAAVTFAADVRRASFAHTVETHRELLQCMAFCFHARIRRLSCPDRFIDGIRLSPREFECLQWAAQGKSSWEIGRILNIAQRTAVFHLENAKAKLGVRSISQAIALFAAAQR